MKFHEILESTIYNSPIQVDDNLYYINNITEKEFNAFNIDNTYSILKPSEIKHSSKIYSKVIPKEDFEYIISSIGLLKYQDVFQDSTHYDFLTGFDDLNQKGIIFIKKRNKDLIKKYDEIKDLDKSNIGLFIYKENNQIKIILYEIDVFNNPIQTLARKSILFYCSVAKEMKSPFGGSSIIKTISRRDVNGQKIMYPFAAFYSDNSILISDRFKVSELAKKVWKDFFSHQNVLYPFAPIDNIAYPLTPQKEDDGYVHSYIKDDLEDIIKNKFSGNKQKFLLKILECQNKNDLDEIYDISPNDIKLLIKNIFDFNQNIDEYLIYKFIYDLIIDHFKIDLSDLRKKNYLDWAYKINPNIESTIKNISNNLINNHLKISVSNRDNKLLEYAEELWENKGLR